MKALIVFFAAILFPISIQAQTMPEWLRVYTFDDKSTIELNTDYVMFGSDKSSRVRFRWNYTELQNLNREQKKLVYKSVLSEYQFDCEKRLYRSYINEYFDADGKLLYTEDYKENDFWKEITSGKIIQSLYASSCRLINFRKREPAVER